VTKKFDFNPFVWSPDDIHKLGSVGSWFYGIVRDSDGKLSIQEIYPGLGHSNCEIDLDDGDFKPVDIRDQLADIASDIMYWSPKTYEADHQNEEKHDLSYLESEESLEEYISSCPRESIVDIFEDNRSLLLKLLDMRYLIDFFMDNKAFSYTLEEVKEYIDYIGIENELEKLIYLDIICLMDSGKYKLNPQNEIVIALQSIDRLMSKRSMEMV
jgi:hypothetical protein